MRKKRAPAKPKPQFTERDVFALAALVGMASTRADPEATALMCYRYADAMLKQKGAEHHDDASLAR